jgi:ABC-2 type transport system ATP-binding protein
MIEVEALGKEIGGHTILEGISFVAPERLMALVGPNGAGKTTLLRIMAGLSRPSSGRLSIAGMPVTGDALEVKRILGYQPEAPRLHPALRGRELLELSAAVRGLEPDQVESWSDRFGARSLLDIPAGELSQGQKRLITLLAATMHRPRVLLLDEPTNALDPHRVADLKEYLRSAEGPDVTLVSTHQLDFVAPLASRFLLLSEGRLVGNGALDDLRTQAGAPGASLEELVLQLTRSRA